MPAPVPPIALTGAVAAAVPGAAVQAAAPVSEPSAIAVANANSIAAAITGDVLSASAAYNEALTYLRLASDHAKFIRNGFDQTQEVLFRQADALAQSLDQLRARFGEVAEPVPPQVVAQFVQAALPVVRQVIQFKERVVAAIRTCTTQQILPADFVDHLRREADFFVGIVNHLAGLPEATNARLDLAGPPQQQVLAIARVLMEVVPVPQAVASNLVYTEFWGKHHEEHADVLTMFLRPNQQQAIAAADRFRQLFRQLRTDANTVQQRFSDGDFAALNRNTLLLTNDWRNFLTQVQQAQRGCVLQTNFVQRLTEHIRIETDILTEAVLRTQLRLQKPTTAVPVATQPGATYNQLTPKEIVQS